ncbi:MAG: hypothetical protein ACLP5H_08590 [Desulfomonilaceae bacterium]
MNKLFERSVINGMELSNRFVRSATWEGMAAEDGSVTPKLTETLVALAKGGIGLIITSHAYVLPEGQAAPWQLGIYKDELINYSFALLVWSIPRVWRVCLIFGDELISRAFAEIPREK